MSKASRNQKLRNSALGAALTVLAGLILWSLPVGDFWVRSSYDYLFRFGSRSVTNNVIILQLDSESYDRLKQTRGQPWERQLHAQVLNRLADDGASMVVFDTFFRNPGDPAVDEELAAAMRRQRCVVLMAEQARVTHSEIAGARPLLPAEPFLSAATNWGVAWLDPDLDGVVRRHWPFPSPGPYQSLTRTVARLSGGTLLDEPHFPWLRYYRHNTWVELSYRFALEQPPNFFRDKVVFIGSHPRTPLPDGEPDEFSTPYTRWSGEATGGVEILITSFLNLINDDWLRRAPAWMEGLSLTVIGILLGGGLCRVRLASALTISAGVLVLFSATAIAISHLTNAWFPWLIVTGGQLPVAAAWSVVRHVRLAREERTVIQAVEPPPEIPGYELAPAPFGEGAYGKVWLARKPGGAWQALKVVYLAKFETAAPFEREFNGVSRYRALSEQHPGLLRVHHVSEPRDGYFYYIMELGDAAEDSWMKDPSRYKPLDLVNIRANLPGNRLPALACVEIGIKLCEALEFLHRNGLAHRDIKPQNVLFVNNEPKLADVGLVAEFRPDNERSLVGTPGYMPPFPEIPGTPAADIYALGMVLYVLNSGGSAALFPEISSTLVASRTPEEFHALNAIIIKACHPDLTIRYASATEMLEALKTAKARLESIKFAGRP